MAPVGVIPFLEASPRRVRHAPCFLGVGGYLRAKASIRFLDWHNGGVLGVVSLLGALCLEPRLGSSLLPSGVRRYPLCSMIYVRPSPVCPRRRLLGIGSSPAIHLPLPLRRSEWMVRRRRS